MKSKSRIKHKKQQQKREFTPDFVEEVKAASKGKFIKVDDFAKRYLKKC